MNKVDAYSKLFEIKDNRLDVNYYLRLMSKSDKVPQEVLDFFEEYDNQDTTDYSNNQDEDYTTEEIEIINGVINEFKEHIRGKEFYRKVLKSSDPYQLAIAVSSFITHYLIERQRSSYEEDTVDYAINQYINMSDITSRLAKYIEKGDLEELAVSVVLIREFLDK